jgi:hypothetical protein
MKTTVREELEHWNVIYVIRRLTIYYNRHLNSYNTKELHGLTGYDFAMNVLEKIINGHRSWENSSCSSFMDFCYGAAKSELSLWRTTKFKKFDVMDVVQENKSNLHIRDEINGF